MRSGLSRMDTKTTLPDLTLHSHLFMDKVSQQIASVEQWDAIRSHVREWVQEVNEWEPVHPFDNLPKEVAQCCQDVLSVLVQIDELSKLREMALSNEAVEVDKIEHAYQVMLKKLHDESTHTESKEMGLKKWLEGKTTQARRASSGLEKQIKDISCECNLKVDSVVRAAQQHADHDGGSPTKDGCENDPLMKELESLMQSCSMEDKEEVLRQKTLLLGEHLEDAQPQQHMPPLAPRFSPTKPTPDADEHMTPVEEKVPEPTPPQPVGGSNASGLAEPKDAQACPMG